MISMGGVLRTPTVKFNLPYCAGTQIRLELQRVKRAIQLHSVLLQTGQDFTIALYNPFVLIAEG